MIFAKRRIIMTSLQHGGLRSRGDEKAKRQSADGWMDGDWENERTQATDKNLLLLILL